MKLIPEITFFRILKLSENRVIRKVTKISEIFF